MNNVYEIGTLCIYQLLLLKFFVGGCNKIQYKIVLSSEIVLDRQATTKLCVGVFWSL
jgi:hypothetical protein